MKHLSLWVTGLLLFACFGSISAQENKDYYKFDDTGTVSEFQLTLADSTVIKYEKPYGTINYTDGTIVDFGSVSNDWYKNLRKMTSAPKGGDMLLNMFGLSSYKINYPDNAQLEMDYVIDQDIPGAPFPGMRKVSKFTDTDNAGGFICFDGPHPRSVNLSVQGNIISGNASSWNEWINDFDRYTFEGQIINARGEIFKGTFYMFYKHCDGYPIFYKNLLQKPALHSSYLKSVSDYLTHCWRGLDDPFRIVMYDGNTIDKNNKIVAMYRDGYKLDDFDMEAALAAEQGKIDKEKAAAEKAISERKALESKYGKKYTDALYEGKVIVGMPWALVEIGNNAHSFKDFYSLLPYMDRTSGAGNSRCYSMLADNFRYIGLIWIKDDKVSSIIFY